MNVVQQRQKSPVVAVIVPLYNKGKYIARTLDSILAQTYQDFEVIVVDDGSTDNGPDIVSSYTDLRLKLIQQANAGPGAARNRGICESTAPLVSFLDADDEWLPQFLEKSVERLQKHPDCVLTVAGHFRCADRISWEAEFRRFGITEGPWRLPNDMVPHLIKPAIDFFHSGAILCSRKVLEQLGGFYAKHRCTYGEDSYLWLQVALNYKVYRDPAALMWYHTEASELGQGRKMIHPPWPILTDPDPIRSGCPPDYRWLLERCLAYYALLAAFRHVNAGDSTTATNLLRCFPLAQTFVRDYIKIRHNIIRAKWLAFLPRLQRWVRNTRSE